MFAPSRSIVATGIAAVTTAAIALIPATAETPTTTSPGSSVHAVSPALRLTSMVGPSVVGETKAAASLATPVLPNLLAEWLERIIVPPSAGTAPPSPSFPPIIVGNSIDSTIKNVYDSVEPWVRYGFELGAYAVGWVPYVGWLSPQVMIFYNFGERIARSITFNIADVLGGNISFVDGLIRVGIDTINSFIFLANDQLAFWLPPLPPLPPIGPFAAAETIPPPAATVETSEDQTVLATATERTAYVTPGPPSTEALAAQASDAAPNVDDQLLVDDQAPTGETTADVAVDAVIELDIEPAVEDSPTTTTSGTVQAQGEVRGSVTAPADPKSSSDTDTSDDGAVSNTGVDDEPAEQPSAAPEDDRDTEATDAKETAKDSDEG